MGFSKLSLSDLLFLSRLFNLTIEEFVNLFEDSYLKEQLQKYKEKIIQETYDINRLTKKALNINIEV